MLPPPLVSLSVPKFEQLSAMASIVAMDEASRKKKIADLLAAKDVSTLSEVFEAASQESVLVSSARPIFTQVLESAGDENTNEAFAQQLSEALLTAIGKRGSRFGEENVRVREILADLYEMGNRPTDAMKILQAIPMEAGLRSNDETYKVSVWVRIAEIALSVDDEVVADTYSGKAWPHLKKVKDAALRLRFQTVFAEVNDSKRKFIDAAQRFYELSHEDIQDHVPALRKATICVLLADVGPRRSRLLQTLYTDERMEQIGDLKQVLNKVYHNRILRPKDSELLAPHLLAHHKAQTANRKTVVENAIIQHNLLSASKLYYNISFTELGALLGLSSAEAEKICAKMVAEDRLKATIDQIDELIIFAADSAAPITQWDNQISAACNSVAILSDSLTQQYPEFTPLLSA